jgi:adenylate cyclase
MTLSTEEGFPHWLAMGTIFRGWALVEQREEGTTQIRQGMAAWRAAGSEELSSMYYEIVWGCLPEEVKRRIEEQ